MYILPYNCSYAYFAAAFRQSDDNIGDGLYRTLINALKDGRYDLTVLNSPCEDEEIFCQRFVDERIDLAVTPDHPLAQRKEVSFADMAGENILLLANIGFWYDVCKYNIPNAKFLPQSEMNALDELIVATDFLCFSSDRMREAGYVRPDRIMVHITDDAAQATYYIACLESNKPTYSLSSVLFHLCEFAFSQ